jgi:nicotinamidase-related amidase
MKLQTFPSPALIVIDMQRFFLAPGADAFLKAAPAIVPNIVRLISVFRKDGRPVIFTRHAHKKGEPTGQMGRWWKNELPFDGDPQSELIEGLNPRKNETVITKARYSAFERTILGPYLKGHYIETVVICGVMTHLCVETTARHAFMLDFQPVVVSDACATQSKEHHEASLLNLGHGFAHVFTTGEILKLTTDEH